MKISQMVSISIRLIGLSLLIFSVIYPFLVGGIGQIWSDASKGNPITIQGETVGLKLIGQQFNSPYFFNSRPSSIAYDAAQSGSANLGPANSELRQRVSKNLKKIANWKNFKGNEIPADLITESGSGLDPHISLEAALFQVPRIAKATGESEEKIKDIVMEKVQLRLFGLYGQKHVNVLQLNLVIREEVLEQ